MVVRELRQDVAAFWNSLDAAARPARDRAGACRPPMWLAERIDRPRRWTGTSLIPGGALPATQASLQTTTSGSSRTDPHGIGCPLGSHVRRANPRDALGASGEPRYGADACSTPRTATASCAAAGSSGRRSPIRAKDDGEDRGLLFMCLNTDIARQFEFIQQTWLLNRDFATLHDETDPLLGPKGPFTIPAEPLRRRVEVETFVQMAGGEYFFLPSLARARLPRSLL